MWRVSVLENKVKLTKKFKKALIKEIKEKKLTDVGDIHGCNVSNWTEEEFNDCLFDGDFLFFNADHFEHIDYLSHNKKLIKFMNKHKLKGKITFGSLDGDQFGQFWGYEFKDGKMKELVGNINWT